MTNDDDAEDCEAVRFPVSAEPDSEVARNGAAVEEAEALIEVLRRAGKTDRGTLNTLVLAVAITLIDQPPPMGRQQAVDELPYAVATMMGQALHFRAQAAIGRVN